jgi:hypothetical protein
MAAVTVTPATAVVVATGGTAVNAIPPNINGGIITNPFTNADQGIGTAEPLYINPVTAAGLAANGTTFALQPGATWSVIPGQSSSTFVNAATSGHKFSAIFW